MITVTKIQRDVLEKMADGWELGEDMGMTGGCDIQQGGQGKGGVSIKLRTDTAWLLWRKGLIDGGTELFPTRHYKLTDKGISLIAGAK
jgi:hypothetical protein